MADTYGLMVEYMKVIGLIIKCMAVENTNGRMGEVMKGNITMIKNMDLVYILG
jgi:hypothetical protein